MEKRCSKCNSWLPHIHYSYIGYCCRKGDVSHHEYYCEFFSELSFEEEFLWCESCKVLISQEELENHLSRGHCLFRGVFVDRDYREEIYEG